MIKRLFFSTLLLTILSPALLLAETFPVSGRVVDRSGHAISGATVKLSSYSLTETTNSNGEFGTKTAILSSPKIVTDNFISISSNRVNAKGFNSNETISLSIFDLRGRKAFTNNYKTNSNGMATISLEKSVSLLGRGIYIISLKSLSKSITFKTSLLEAGFSNTNNTISYRPNRTSRVASSFDTLTITHKDYQSNTIFSVNTTNNYTITLDPYGPDNIPVLLPDVSGHLYVTNSSGIVTDTLKVFSVMPPAGVKEWNKIITGTSPTGVKYDTTLTTPTTMKADIIRNGMANDSDWQSAFATARIGNTPFKNLTKIVIRYRVNSPLDSIALSLNEVNSNGVIGEYTDYGAYRCVLKKGVQNPGEYVTDTLSLSDFTVAWADSGAPVSTGDKLSNNTALLSSLQAISFTNELNPWPDGNSEPVNNGDTISVTVAGILFGTNSSDPVDTTVDTTTGYSVHSNIMASTFWCGESASDANDFITNTQSAWMVNWGGEFGVEDKPLLDRDSDFIPTSSSYNHKENPYYFALPYDDFGAGVYDGAGTEDNSQSLDSDGRKTNAYSAVYWSDEKTKNEWGDSISMCKNRWIKIKVSGSSKVCYAQWEDAGPYYYNDINYVFGNGRPSNTTDAPYAGIDLAPSVCLYLNQQLEDWGAPNFEVDWNFVAESEVPDGPWKKVVTHTNPKW